MSRNLFIVGILTSLLTFNSIVYVNSGYENSPDLEFSERYIQDRIHVNNSNCAESECVYLPVVIKSGIGSWVKYSDPVLEPGSSGSWDDFIIACPDVIFDGTKFRMWYEGRTVDSNYEIGYAISFNGIDWEKHQTNPVLKVGESGSWDNQYVSDPVVKMESTVWKMWYGGGNNLFNSQIGYATSNDGVTWVKSDQNPVLSPGESGSWDEEGVRSPYVILIEGENHMFYNNQGDHQGIGYATSEDGIHWSKFNGNPVLMPEEPQGYPIGLVTSMLSDPSVVDIWGTYHMWAGYFATEVDFSVSYSSGYIGHTTSKDGLNWVDIELGLPHSPGYFNFESCPSVVIHNHILKMWYTSGGKIFYAEAPLIPK